MKIKPTLSRNAFLALLRVAFLLLISLNTFSQKYVITYLDSTWSLTSKEFAAYFRTGILDTKKYTYYGEVKDFYMNGKLQMKGTFVANMKTDTFYFYYPSGNLMTKGCYKDNYRYGIWYEYYDDGRLKNKLAFNNDFICALESYNADGSPQIINGTGHWEADYYEDFTTSLMHVSGDYKDTLRDGTWHYYNTSLVPGIEGVSNVKRLECIEEYDNGSFLKGKYYWGGGGIQDISVPTMRVFPERKKFENLEKWSYSIYASVDLYPFLKFLPKVDSTVFPVTKEAQFPGGIDSLRQYFVRNMKFTQSYIDSQDERSCMFKVMVDENGKLSIIEDPNIPSLMSYPSEKLFYRISLKSLKSMPRWESAVRGNENVRSYFMIAILMRCGEVSVVLKSINIAR
jgi:antitoxin component YwqK of YwqJK toxin-antitoxin module